MKKLYIIIVALGLVVIAAYLILRFKLQSGLNTGSSPAAVAPSPKASGSSALDLRPLFTAKLQQIVSDGSGGLYALLLDSMEVDILQSKVVLRNVKLHPNFDTLAALDKAKKAPDNVFKLRLDRLYIDGVNLDDVLTRKTIDVNTIRLSAPVIEVYRQKRTYNKGKEEDTTTLYQRILKHIESIAVTKIIIEKGTLTSRQPRKNKQTTLSDIHVLLTDVLIDSTTQKDKSRFLFAKGAELSCRNYEMKTKDDLYLFKTEALSVTPAKNRLTATGVYLLPRYNKQQFQRQLTHRKERYHLAFPKISFHNIRWWDLLNEEELMADEVTIDKGKLHVYLNRSLPPGKPRTGSYPHQLIMKLPLPVGIKKLTIRDVDLVYEEFTPASGKSGIVQLSSIKGSAHHITNIPLQIKKNNWTTVTATALFLNRVPIHSTFRFNLKQYKKGNFSVRVNIDGFDAQLLNPVSEPLGLFSIKKGNVKKATATIDGNNELGAGKLLLLYNDLKITILEKDSQENGLDKKRVMSFLANTLVIKDNNPSEAAEPPRHPEGTFQRMPEGSFFNLVWKTMLVGILKSVGAKPELAVPKQKK